MVCAVLRTVRSRPFGASSRAYSTTVSIIHAIYDDQDSGEHCIILCKVNLGNYLRYMFILLIYLYGHSHFHLVLPRLYYEMNELRSLGVTERVVYMCVMRSKLTFRNSKPVYSTSTALSLVLPRFFSSLSISSISLFFSFPISPSSTSVSTSPL